MGQAQSHHHVARPDYPYGSAPLLPQWGGRWARGLALLIIACAGYSTVLHGADWSIDRIALLIILPALLGITLAFAPDPPSFVSRLAKRLTTAGCAVGTLAGPWLAPLILGVPVLLATSVAVGAIVDARRA